jgi:hypothetical protein
MKAVLIDSKNRRVVDIEYDGDYKSIYRLIGCEAFDVVRGPHGDDIFIDDEGLLRIDKNTVFFSVPWYPTPLAGSGLMLSLDNSTGESIAAVHDADFYRPQIKFESAAAVWLRNQLNGAFEEVQ